MSVVIAAALRVIEQEEIAIVDGAVQAGVAVETVGRPPRQPTTVHVTLSHGPFLPSPGKSLKKGCPHPKQSGPNCDFRPFAGGLGGVVGSCAGMTYAV